MKKEFLKQLKYFKKVNIPKYIDVRIQETALKHLELPDMGKLRDRMEGQLYYDKLKNDIFSEFAFEYIIGLRKFEFEKRDEKFYKRKHYNFGDKTLSIITFTEETFPKISVDHVDNCVFINVNPELFAYVSGLATKSIIKQFSEMNGSKIIEISNFKGLKNFDTIEELVGNLE